ncbi:MAG: tetratricopeptide repeat protein [Elusimicrobia bacterium]|nr:tetratricopeptide repeat protein [Elusimicrobiota bacterium]
MIEGPAASLLLGFAKTTLVHRHAFIPSPSQTREIGCGARLPRSFWPAVSEALAWSGEAQRESVEAAIGAGKWPLAAKRLEREPSLRVLRAVILLFGAKPGGESLFDGFIERYAARAGCAELEALAAEHPEHWPAWVWLGLAQLRRCEFAAAKGSFDRLVKLRPDWAWAYLLRSEWGRVDIEFGPALRDLDRAARLEPANAWVYALRSRVRFQKEPGPDGIKDLDEAVRLDAGAGWMRAWRGDARRKLGNAKGAVEDLLAAKRLEPEYDRTYLWLGKVLQSLGLHERALASLDEAVSRCPYFEKAFSQRSQVLRRLGRCAEAIKDLNEAVRVNHRHNWLGSWTAETYPLRPEHFESLETLRAFCARAPRSAWGLAWLGESKVQAGDLLGGLADLDAALRSPSSPCRAWAYAWRGEAQLRRGSLERAAADLDRALRLDPSYGRAYAWRGRLNQLEGRHKAAAADLSRAVGDSLVEYSWLYHWRALSYAGLKDWRRAASDARAAVSLEPHRPEFREALARTARRRPPVPLGAA